MIKKRFIKKILNNLTKNIQISNKNKFNKA